MMTPALTASALAAKRGQVLELAGRHGASNIRVFGSVARGQADAMSDLDLLVDLEPSRSLLDLVAPIQDLEELLGVKVDVAEATALPQEIKAAALADSLPL